MSRTASPTRDAAEHADLLARAAGGDQDAFMALYDATSAHVYALFRYRLGTRDAAAEAAHALYLTAWSRAAEHAGSGLSALAWLIWLGSETGPAAYAPTGRTRRVS